MRTIYARKCQISCILLHYMQPNPFVVLLAKKISCCQIVLHLNCICVIHWKGAPMFYVEESCYASALEMHYSNIQTKNGFWWFFAYCIYTIPILMKWKRISLISKDMKRIINIVIYPKTVITRVYMLYYHWPSAKQNNFR